jgi:hypothetical protein
MKRDWIFVHQRGDYYEIECERCRHVLGLRLPIMLTDLSDAALGFQMRHRRCKRSLHGERCQLLGVLRRRAHPEGGSFTITMRVG